jgi:epsilon-lactone hydrolase
LAKQSDIAWSELIMTPKTTSPMPVEVRKFEIDPTEIAAARKLHTDFARFWSEPFDDMRTRYDEFVAATPVAQDITFREAQGDPAHGWWCNPKDAAPDKTILFIHGGGYGLGSAKAYRGLASQIAAHTKTKVFVLEYPLAPEAKLPTAFNIAVETISKLSANGRVAIVGDSAGGGLTLASTAKLAGNNNLAAVVAFSPWTDLTLSGESMRSMAVSDISLDPEYLRQSALNYAGETPLNDPDCSPLFGIPTGMPPVLLQVGTDEILRDDSIRYAESSARLGNAVELEIYEGMHHVFPLNIKELKTSRLAVERAANFLLTHLQQ